MINSHGHKTSAEKLLQNPKLQSVIWDRHEWLDSGPLYIFFKTLYIKYFWMFRQSTNTIENTVWGHTSWVFMSPLVKCPFIVHRHSWWSCTHVFWNKDNPFLSFSEEFCSSRPQRKSHVFHYKDLLGYVHPLFKAWRLSFVPGAIILLFMTLKIEL